MDIRPNPFPITKLIKLWDDLIGVDPKVIFQALAEIPQSITHAAWLAQGRKAVQTLPPSVFDGDPARLVYVMIWRALTQTLFELTFEATPILFRLTGEEQASLIQGLDYSFAERNLEIGPAFFDPAGRNTLLEGIKGPFKQWLKGQGLMESKLDGLPTKLQPYFFAALDQEFREHHKDYQQLSPYLGPFFSEPSFVERAWLSYGLHLQKQIYQPLLGIEPLTLAQLYVAPRAYLETDEDLDIPAGAMAFEAIIPFLPKRKNVTIDVIKSLEDWVNDDAGSQDLLFLAGPPGFGKTSLTKIFSARLADGRTRVLRVPLEDFSFDRGLVQGLDHFLTSLKFFPDPSRDAINDRDKLVIIFDELSDLKTGEGLIEEKVLDFIRQVKHLLLQANQEKRRLLVMLTGLANLARSLDLELPAGTPIYFLLPFFIPDGFRPFFGDPEELLNQDQRDLWWHLYSQASGFSYGGRPPALRNLGPGFELLLSHPSLNLLAALALERGQIKFSGATNLIDLIEDYQTGVFSCLTDEKRPYSWLYRLNRETFLSGLMCLAVTAWHSPEGLADMNIARECFAKHGLMDHWPAFVDLAQSGVLGLLHTQTRSWELDAPFVFKFSHQAWLRLFQAKRILVELKALKEDLDRRAASRYAGLDERAALVRWTELCGPKAMDWNLSAFCGDSVRLESDGTVEEWQRMIVRLIEYALRHGLPVDSLPGAGSFKLQGFLARNAEEALLAVHFACTTVTKKISRLSWPSPTSAGEWIRRLAGQRSGSLNRVILNSLGFLDFSGCLLDGLDLLGANLINADLSGASLRFACLSRTGLTHAVLVGANLQDSQMTRANLERAYLGQADLRRANLQKAKLRQADLTQADLTQANLAQADLQEADLRGADLRKANLSGANLKWADMDGALLDGADLAGAVMSEGYSPTVRLF